MPFEQIWGKDDFSSDEKVSSGFRFFEQITDLVKKEGKQIAAIDPQNFYLNLWMGLGEPGVLTVPAGIFYAKLLQEKLKGTSFG